MEISVFLFFICVTFVVIWPAGLNCEVKEKEIEKVKVTEKEKEKEKEKSYVHHHNDYEEENVGAEEEEEENNNQENSEGCGCSAGLSRNLGDLSTATLHQSDQSGKMRTEQSGESESTCESPETNTNEENKNNDNMAYIPGGYCYMGTNNPKILLDGEGPRRPINVSAFYMDKYEVSNEHFKVFVDATNFKSESESFGWSFVIDTAVPDHIKEQITQAVLGAEWWLPVEGSYWREPEGPGTDVFSASNPRGDYPVVQVSHSDATSYCQWRGARLPTEAEWEVAVQGADAYNSYSMSEDENIFPWGNEMKPGGTHRMNIFQGKFPAMNTAADGHAFMAPVTAFGEQNEYGLYNMIGNVWEWVQDWYTTDHPSDLQVNPIGPAGGKDRVKKGGSFLCHKSYCFRYRSAARFPSTPDSAAYNIGFRCAKN